MNAVDQVPEYIRSLIPYAPGKPIDEVERELGITGSIKLASNENPLGPSPRAVEAMRGALDRLHLYPSGGLELRRKLAELYDLKMENVIVGSGSEGIMANIIRTFL
ncbi:MAG TPA: histidinol-phosphate transaminase, partial [Candidatus Binatia bacterium]|nr:histidinol-phosphate transaminase [Candidatus Binatia bacterium]